MNNDRYKDLLDNIYLLKINDTSLNEIENDIKNNIIIDVNFTTLRNFIETDKIDKDTGDSAVNNIIDNIDKIIISTSTHKDLFDSITTLIKKVIIHKFKNDLNQINDKGKNNNDIESVTIDINIDIIKINNLLNNMVIIYNYEDKHKNYVNQIITNTISIILKLINKSTKINYKFKEIKIQTTAAPPPPTRQRQNPILIGLNKYKYNDKYSNFNNNSNGKIKDLINTLNNIKNIVPEKKNIIEDLIKNNFENNADKIAIQLLNETFISPKVDDSIKKIIINLVTNVNESITNYLNLNDNIKIKLLTDFVQYIITCFDIDLTKIINLNTNSNNIPIITPEYVLSNLYKDYELKVIDNLNDKLDSIEKSILETLKDNIIKLLLNILKKFGYVCDMVILDGFIDVSNGTNLNTLLQQIGTIVISIYELKENLILDTTKKILDNFITITSDDCDPIVKSYSDYTDNIQEIINNVDTFASNKYYYNKYLKYKNKYIQLKIN
jgi:hypothetical protein